MDKNLECWKGKFGDDYLSRNPLLKNDIKTRTFLWAKILEKVKYDINTVLEVGASLGASLYAINNLINADLYALEPHQTAYEELIKSNLLKDAYQKSIFETDNLKDDQFDLVFTGGVLILISPEHLKTATDNIVRLAKKYIVCIEYFSDRPESINYHGYEDILFKRDFGSFFLENYPELKILDYAFEWKPRTGMGNSTWWLFQKES